MFYFAVVAVVLVSVLPNYLAKNEYITTGYGVPVDNLEASLSIGPRGPILLEDLTLFDYLSKFTREKIPERIVHPKGTGAFGYFEVTNNITEYCAADIFSEVGKRTPLVARLSGTASEVGVGDTNRDSRGLAVKFYTDEGNWDLVTISFPVLNTRDPMLFPAFIHAARRQPSSNIADINNFIDLVLKRNEAVHAVMYLFSDLGTPASYRNINGYSISTFKLINKSGGYVYARFGFFTNQGIKNLTSTEALTLQLSSKDYYTKDLYTAIEERNYPSWTLKIQVMTETQFVLNPFDPFDNTKIWPEDTYPWIEAGVLTLNKNPDNQFAQIEQLALSPSHLVPGIKPSHDKILQGRLFAYPDTHRHRLGVNHLQLPVNRPIIPVRNYQRHGPMVYNNQGNATTYYPNTKDNLTISDRATQLRQPYYLSGGVVDRYDSLDQDDFSQPKIFYEEILDDTGKQHLAENLAGLLGILTDTNREGSLELFEKVSKDLRSKIEAVLAAS